MIAIIYGTTAELIKLAPVYQRLAERGSPPQLWTTGQHVVELPEVAKRLGLPRPDVELARGRNGRNLSRVVDIPIWATSIASTAARRRRELEQRLWSDDRPPLVLVHGDTMTTVIGAALGRWLGSTVGHIEAGLRSNRLFEPFPEELDRRVAARLAHVHYAPGIDKFQNIWARGGVKVDTIANTVLDSLRMVPATAGEELAPLPRNYGLVSLHRFELLRDPESLTGILDLLREWSQKVPMLVVTDAQCSAQLTRLGLDDRFDDDHLIRVGKLPYFEFVSVLKRAAFVITDSGGLQEECAYLNIPCLVHRNTTERTEGLGANALLSMYDLDVVSRFLAEPARYRAVDPPRLPSPADIIVDHVAKAGHIEPADRPARPRADVAVIVPAFDQAEVIQPAVENLLRAMPTVEPDHEVLVVASDSKGDSTALMAEQVESDRVLVLRYASDAGQSFAFKYAAAQTDAAYVVLADPTMLVAPDNITNALQRLRTSGADLIAGSKVLPGSHVVMTRGRRVQTSVFSRLVRRLFDVPVSDPQLGLKAFRREVLAEILPHTHSTGFAFGIEVIATAADLGYRIEESPVEMPGRMKAIRDPFWLARAAAGCTRLFVLRIQLAFARRPRRTATR